MILHGGGAEGRGDDFAPRKHSATSKDIFGCHNLKGWGGGSTGI